MKEFNVAIVGAGRGGLAVMDLAFKNGEHKLRMQVIGVADINSEAPGLKRARELNIFATTNYRDLLSIEDLHLILELTGRPEVSRAIQREKPEHVQFMDHTVSRLFWDIIHTEKEGFIPEEEAKKQINAVSSLFMDVIDLEEDRRLIERKAEEQVRIERDKTAKILNSLTEAVVVVNQDYLITEANEAFAKNFGSGAESVVGKLCTEILSAHKIRSPSSFFNTVHMSLNTKKVNRQECQFQRNGKPVYYDVVYTPITDLEGQYSRCLISMTNISHRKMLELDLEKSRHKYKNLFELARDGISLFTMDGEIKEANISLRHMLGYSLEEIRSMKVSLLAEKMSRSILSDYLEDLSIMGFVSVELDFVKKNGDPLPVEANIRWVAEDKIFQMIARDITIRRKLDESRERYSEQLEKEVEKRTEDLRASQQEALLQKEIAEGIITGSPIPMFVLDKGHKISYWNRACEKLTGYNTEEMIGTDGQWKPFFPKKRPLLADLVIEDNVAQIHELYDGMNLRKSSMVEGAYEAEHYFPHLGKDGTHLYFNAAPIKDDEGGIQGAIVTYQDFSERVKMTEELKTSQQEALRQKEIAEGIITGSPIPMLVLDKDHKVSYWNRACEKLTGYKAEGMIGTDGQWRPFFPQKRPLMADLVIENDIEKMHELYDDMNLRKSPMVEDAFEAEHYFPNLGEEGTHLYFNAAPIKDDEGGIQGAIVTYQDFSERVKMTQEIQKREAFVQNLIQNSIDGIIATDEKGTIVIFNRGVADILGYSPEEIIDKMNYSQFLTIKTAKNIRKAFYGKQFGPKGKIINMETDLLDKESQSIPIRISGTLLYEQQKEVGSVVFVQDLREIHRLRDEREQAQRLAAIGQTVSGLAHYIKNILNGLKGGEYVINSAMKKEDLSLVGKGWRIMQKNIDQISQIVLDMLTYSKERKPEYQPVDPNELVNDVVELMKERAKASGVSLVLKLRPDMGEVFMDRTGIHRCLLNLVSNAIDACTMEGITSGEGRVTIATDESQEWGVRFEVKDNGTGMDEKVQKNLFEGFFSTKGNKGTGLGLAVTQKIVKEHKGELTFDSKVGEGTALFLALPEVEADGESRQ